MQNLFDNMNEGFAIHEVFCDSDGNPVDYAFLEVNKAFEVITQLKSEVIKGKRITEILPNTEKVWIEKYGKVALTGVSDHFVNYSGELDKYFSVSVYSPSKNQFATLFTDVSDIKRLEKILSQEKNLLLTTLHALVDGVISTDENGRIDMMNPAAEELTGWQAIEAKGESLEEVFCIRQEKNILLTQKGGNVIPIEYAASPIIDHTETSRGHVIIFRDYTEKLEKEERILYLSYHDQLTGLYNRRFFEEESIRLNTARNLPLTLAVCDVNGLKLTNDAFGHLAGDELLKKISEILRVECRSDDIIARIGGDEFAIILPKTDAHDAENIVSRIYEATQLNSVNHIILSISIGWSVKTDMRQSMEDVFVSAEEMMYRRKLTESQSMRNQTIKTILNTLYTQNQREQAHSERVSKISVEIGRALGFEYNMIKDLETASLMHDIGKIVLDTALLTKSGEITDKEYEEIKRHPECSYQILKSVDQYSDLADYVLSHHEHWDGKGYPRGLVGDEIPLISRIITVADAYDSMTTDRPYRKAMSKEEALDELSRCAGSQFDSNIVNVFIKLDIES
ncbi:MAG TPA: diguanylate cyclase [Clostridiales bacterium UBA8960]|nr:diguanylate cyclase [Clostridiales bacterium UBA8960]